MLEGFGFGAGKRGLKDNGGLLERRCCREQGFNLMERVIQRAMKLRMRNRDIDGCVLLEDTLLTAEFNASSLKNIVS